MNRTKAPDTARVFGLALGKRNYPRAAALLAAAAHLDAILPGRHLVVTGRDRIAALWVEWFDWATAVEFEDLRVSQVGDRTSLTWRGLLRTDDPDIGDRLFEQHMVLDVGNDGIDRIALLCTGFRPPTLAAAVRRHDSDAGEIRCTDGFPSNSRRQLNAMDVGRHLRAMAGDVSSTH